MSIEYIKCPHCGYELCYMDRRLEECTMCGKPLPEEIRLDE